VTNLFDAYFAGGRDHRVERPSIEEVPYLEGDYWPGEAERLLGEMASAGAGGAGAGAGDLAGAGAKARKASKGARGAAGALARDATPGEALLARLGDALHKMREDFIVAQLCETCCHCRGVIDGGVRHVHPAPPPRVTLREGGRVFEGLALDRPGGEPAATRTLQISRFQLCDACFRREAGADPAGARPLGLPSGIELAALCAVPVPPLPPLRDAGPPRDSEFFDTRHAFLSLCAGEEEKEYKNRRCRSHCSSLLPATPYFSPTTPAFPDRPHFPPLLPCRQPLPVRLGAPSAALLDDGPLPPPQRGRAGLRRDVQPLRAGAAPGRGPPLPGLPRL
jgi:E1A/CREB-binding protein